MIWYFHLFKNFPQFVVIHTIKGFDMVNKAEVDFVWNSLAFLMIQLMLGEKRESQKGREQSSQ